MARNLILCASITLLSLGAAPTAHAMYSPTLGCFINRDPGMNPLPGADVGRMPEPGMVRLLPMGNVAPRPYAGRGYHDGMNLYSSYFVPNGVDPTGLWWGTWTIRKRTIPDGQFAGEDAFEVVYTAGAGAPCPCGKIPQVIKGGGYFAHVDIQAGGPGIKPHPWLVGNRASVAAGTGSFPISGYTESGGLFDAASGSKETTFYDSPGVNNKGSTFEMEACAYCVNAAASKAGQPAALGTLLGCITYSWDSATGTLIGGGVGLPSNGPTGTFKDGVSNWDAGK